jgi:ribonuclease inhibitor
MMNNITIDFSDVNNQRQLHALLKRALSLPDYYGENLDALWDMLGGWIDTPVKLKLNGLSHLRRQLGTLGDQVIDVFHKASIEIPGIDIEVN